MLRLPLTGRLAKLLARMFGEIRNSLAELYRQDARPWLVGYSGGKDSTMVTSLVVDALLAQPPEQSFWVNSIGRGFPPPNRIFRWCTQRLKIDPVTSFVNKRIGHCGEAILHLGVRRAESASRAQTMAGRVKRNGPCRHPDLPRVWGSNPIEHLTTEEVWAYLVQSQVRQEGGLGLIGDHKQSGKPAENEATT